MSIICKQCGYENPDRSTVCEICAEPLNGSHDTSEAIPSAPVKEAPAADPPSASPQTAETADAYEYFVVCPESNTKTMLPNGHLNRFYCEGCKKDHDIDGFLWTIEKKEKEKKVSSDAAATSTSAKPSGDVLWLEEITSHYRIQIDKLGGTLGRYGKYGAEFFQSRGMLTVSGEHCMITNEFGNWVIRHISKTNQTKYNNMLLGTNEPTLLEEGKLLTLANTVSFVVRMG